MRSVILAALIGMTPIAFGTITEIDFDDENSEDIKTMAQWTEFHKATPGAPDQPKPRIEDFKKPKRHFIAKRYASGVDLYFEFETDEDIDNLIHGATYHGGGFWTCWLSWYYYDEESNA